MSRKLPLASPRLLRAGRELRGMGVGPEQEVCYHLADVSSLAEPA